MNYCQSVTAWLGHRQVQRNIYEYVSYIFRIQLFIVPIDVSKPNTLITTEITQWVSQQKKHQLLLQSSSIPIPHGDTKLTLEIGVLNIFFCLIHEV